MEKCPACQDLKPREALRPGPSRLVIEYKNRALAGCQRCGLLLDATEVFKPGWTDGKYDARRSIELTAYRSPLIVFLIVDGDVEDRFEILQRSDVFSVIGYLYFSVLSYLLSLSGLRLHLLFELFLLVYSLSRRFWYS
jgi:hypothetical protein